MDLQPGVLYQHRAKRPFRLTGRQPCYLGIDETGRYFTQDQTGIRMPLSRDRGDALRNMSIPLIPPDQQLPPGF